jgi:dTDP-4-dehydrorhamnose reductase
MCKTLVATQLKERESRIINLKKASFLRKIVVKPSFQETGVRLWLLPWLFSLLWLSFALISAAALAKALAMKATKSAGSRAGSTTGGVKKEWLKKFGNGKVTKAKAKKNQRQGVPDEKLAVAYIRTNSASNVGDDKDIASHVNTELPREILRIQADVGFHAVLLGSAAEYGLRKNPEPLSETSELRPLGAYGASKAAQSELAEAAILAGADLTYVRAFNLVDLGMKSNLLPGRLENSVKQAMIDNSLAIRVNRADDVRDFLQLTDFCSILLNLVSLRSFSVFNVASGQGKSVGEFAEYFVHELLGQPDFTVEKLYTLAPTFSLADISKLKGALTDG